jgi:prepilin peptidase CpaA
MDSSHIAVLTLAAVASFCDLRTRRIPNLVTFGGAAAALAYAFALHGVAGLTASLGGWFTGAALFLPFFILGGMGAGDVKLLACLGAWLGHDLAIYTAMYAALAGGVMAVGLGLATGYLSEALRNVWLLIMHWRVMGPKPLPSVTLQGSRSPRLPYALPIAAGVIFALWFNVN